MSVLTLDEPSCVQEYIEGRRGTIEEGLKRHMFVGAFSQPTISGQSPKLLACTGALPWDMTASIKKWEKLHHISR
jgi:hypothetical protein